MTLPDEGRPPEDRDAARLSWRELEVELDRLSEYGARDLAQALRALEIYQEEIERQKRELEETHRVLEESRDRYLLLFETAPIGYLSVGRTGVIEEVNAAGLELLGCPRSVALGASLFGFLRSGERFARHLRRLAAGEGSVRDEVWLTRRDGAPMLVELFSRPGPRGSAYRTVVTDLTERRREEEQRRMLAVRERTARETSEAKDRFLAVLGHELRTPLSPVLASVDLIERDPAVPAHVQPHLERIRRNVEAEARLIGDLLDLTRLRHGALELERAEVDVHDVLREVATAQQAHGRTVKTRLDAGSSRTWADGVRLLQIASSLVRNALAASDGGGEVRIDTWNPTARSLRIVVSDSGSGIDAADLQRIFEPFESSRAPGRPGGGLGLGLTIAKTLVEAHGGTIAAKSDGLGRGSAFFVDLPLQEAPHEKPAPAARPEAELDAVAAGTPAAKRRILVVDDHEDSAVTLGQILSHRGFEVRTATSMARALEVVASGAVDVLVSDIALPDGTGHELLDRLRRNGGTPIAIAVSGFGNQADLDASRSAGFVEHLTKPIDPELLLTAIRRQAST